MTLPDPTPSETALSATALRDFFRARGWSIHLDDRPGQDVWPFDVLAAHIAATRAARPAAEPGLRDIVERTARMGLCSQTHHEHLSMEAYAALAASEPVAAGETE